MTRAQMTALKDNLTSALSFSEDLFKEMVRLADELNAAKERVAELEKENEELKEENEALKRENERLEHRLNCEIDHYNRLEHRAEELSTMLLKESEEKERLEEQFQLLRETLLLLRETNGDVAEEVVL